VEEMDEEQRFMQSQLAKSLVMDPKSNRKSLILYSPPPSNAPVSSPQEPGHEKQPQESVLQEKQNN